MVYNDDFRFDFANELKVERPKPATTSATATATTKNIWENNLTTSQTWTKFWVSVCEVEKWMPTNVHLPIHREREAN